MQAPDLVAEVDAALDRLRNQQHRRGAAATAAAPDRGARRRLKITDETALLDRLLMRKLDARSPPSRRAAKLADEGYQVFMQAARVRAVPTTS